MMPVEGRLLVGSVVLVSSSSVVCHRMSCPPKEVTLALLTCRAFGVAEREKCRAALQGLRSAENVALQGPKCAEMRDIFRAFGTHLRDCRR